MAKKTKECGAEIDLVIDRADHCINLCEIKFYEGEFCIDQAYAKTLQTKKSCFENLTKTKKSTFLTLITTYGTKRNNHFHSVVDQEIQMDALFLK